MKIIHGFTALGVLGFLIFGRSRVALDCCEGALDAFMGMMDDGIRKVFEY